MTTILELREQTLRDALCFIEIDHAIAIAIDCLERCHERTPWLRRRLVATLLERKVDFICCDNPIATKFTTHILAAAAEFERDAISKRTKEAPPAAKARGTTRDGRPLKLGNIAETKQRATAARAEAVWPASTSTLHLSTRAPPTRLNRRCNRTASAKPRHPMQVLSCAPASRAAIIQF